MRRWRMKIKTGSKPKIQRLRMAITKYNMNELASVSLSMPPWEMEDGQKGSRDVATLRGDNTTSRGEEQNHLPKVFRQKV